MDRILKMHIFSIKIIEQMKGSGPFSNALVTIDSNSDVDLVSMLHDWIISTTIAKS
jgi:hypothetical protein